MTLSPRSLVVWYFEGHNHKDSNKVFTIKIMVWFTYEIPNLYFSVWQYDIINGVVKEINTIITG